MKKIVIAAVCGLCLMAGAVVASGADVTVAGSAGGIHVSF